MNIKQQFTILLLFTKKFASLLIVLSFAAVLLAACGSVSAGCGSSSTSSSSGAPTASMCSNTFAQSTITINKGQSLTLVNDAADQHIIANGSWENGTAQSARETGAPQVNNVTIGGNSSATIGPFNTAGTFKLYCTVHPGMNLTVIVK
jgi:plastocyanin